MLLGNVTQYNANGIRNNGAFGANYTNYKPSVWFNFYSADQVQGAKTLSFPTGTQPPYSWLLPLKGGELSSTTNISGVGSMTSNMLSGKFMTATLSGAGSMVSNMSLITSMTATLAGVGSLSGTMKLTLAMAATLAGVGSLSGSMNMLIPLIATLSGTGSLSGNLKGNARLEATIYVNSGTASTQELVAAIWSALAADYNESGTMGQKLNGAGSAGDPWTTDLTSYNTDGTAGKRLKDTLSTGKFLALK
jgi:hypothetical protein